SLESSIGKSIQLDPCFFFIAKQGNIVLIHSDINAGFRRVDDLSKAVAELQTLTGEVFNMRRGDDAVDWRQNASCLQPLLCAGHFCRPEFCLIAQDAGLSSVAHRERS